MPRTSLKKPPIPEKVVANPNQIVHEVHLLDGSGSMRDDNKYDNAVIGINSDINASINASKELGLKGTISVIQFASSWGGNAKSKDDIHMVDILKVKSYNAAILNGGTPLYQNIGETIEKFIKAKAKEDKVLLKIFTDGGENASTGKYHGQAGANLISKMIKDAEDNHNFTVTFVGTSFDVDTVVKNLNVNRSNTMSHNNTAKGVADAFLSMTSASVAYKGKLSRGEDVSREFYTKSKD